MLSDLAAGILRVQVCTRWQSRRISARGRDWDSGNGRLSAVFAAWVCVSMAQLANGPAASRTVTYDHDCDFNCEDDEDGWSVVGGDRQCAVWADRAKSADGAGSMGGGRYEVLVCEDKPDDDGFFECDCDNADLR